VYTAAMILPHEPVNDLFLLLQQKLRAPLYSALFGSLLAAAAVGGVVWFLRSVGGRDHAPLRWAVAGGTVAVLAASYTILVAVITESVHFPQYFILFLLIFALRGRIGEAAVWCTLIGMIDEAYQYVVLHPGWAIYFDFNDVILNFAGAALGACAVLGCCRLQSAAGTFGARARKVLSPAVWTGLGAFALYELLRLAGYAALYPPATGPRPPVLLSRHSPDPTFWTFAEWSQKSFHILTPVEGTSVTAALCLLFSLVDAVVQWSPRARPAAAETEARPPES
jgi:VanZ like family